MFYQDKIFVAGGECRDKKTYPEFEAYDLKTTRWSAFAPMPMGRHGFGRVVVGNSVYYAGGAVECGGGGRTNELLMLSLFRAITISTHRALSKGTPSLHR